MRDLIGYVCACCMCVVRVCFVAQRTSLLTLPRLSLQTAPLSSAHSLSNSCRSSQFLGAEPKSKKKNKLLMPHSGFLVYQRRETCATESRKIKDWKPSAQPLCAITILHQLLSGLLQPLLLTLQNPGPASLHSDNPVPSAHTHVTPSTLHHHPLESALVSLPP